MNGKTITVLAAFLALSISAGATTTPPPTGFVCKKTLGAILIDQDLVIPQNKKCTLDGTIVTGKVTVGLNAFLIAKNGAFIGGDLVGNIPANILVSDTTVAGNVDINELGSAGGYDFNCLQIGTSSIGGDVLVDSTNGRLKLLPGETNPVGNCLEINSNFIGGNLLVENTIETPLISNPLEFLITANSTGNDLTYQSNSVESSIADNTTGNALNFLCNTAAGDILRNTVNGDLNYQSGAPVPTVQDNTVFGSENSVDCL